MKKALNPKPPNAESQNLLSDLKSLIEQGKRQAAAAVNSAITLTYWQVGKRINDEVLQGERAEYGKQVVASLAQELAALYGKSFELRNLRRMMQFAQTYPNFQIVSPLVSQLSWSHFTILISLSNHEARAFYARHAMEGQWSKRELQHHIERKAYERAEIADSKLALAEASHLSGNFKDPYFLDFLGLKIDRFKAAFKGQMELYLNWLNQHERQEGEEAPIGLILCTQAGSEQVELLNLQKDNIMVAEYWTQLPSKQQLEAKLHTALIEVRERLTAKKLLGEGE